MIDCIRIVIIALPAFVKCWNQYKYASIGDKLMKILFRHTMEYYAGTKKNELDLYILIWKDV